MQIPQRNGELFEFPVPARWAHDPPTCHSPLTGPKRDKALVSAGGGLRRTATRPKPVAAPGRLTLKNTAFAGEVEARWGRVGNAHYYEYQLAVTLSSPEPVLFDTLPILANGPTSCLYSGHPVGYYLTLSVRGNGS